MRSRLELRPWGISVSLIQPGAVKTPIWDKGLRMGAELLRNSPPEVMRLYGAAVEIATKMAQHENETGVEPIEVARAVAHALLSPHRARGTPSGGRRSCSSRCPACFSNTVMSDRLTQYRIAPEGYGEIIGGGQRMSSYELLAQRIKEHDLPREAFEWYLDLRKYGSVPHAGFGMGIERAVTWICGLEHVRETIPFPRMLYRLKP